MPASRSATSRARFIRSRSKRTGDDTATLAARARQRAGRQGFRADCGSRRPAAAPQTALFHESVGGQDYLLAMVTPPTLDSAAKLLPRELIFVIDNSGSMAGTSIVQAKQSLLFALDRLRAGDKFNVVRFDDTMETLFDHGRGRHVGKSAPSPRISCRGSMPKAARRCCPRSRRRSRTRRPTMRPGSARWCSSPTARSATRRSYSRRSPATAAARACSPSASARRRTSYFMTRRGRARPRHLHPYRRRRSRCSSA